MPESDKSLEVFDECVSRIMKEKLSIIQEKINSLDSADTVDVVVEMLVEANTWINLICGDNAELFEDWRYRLFALPGGSLMVIQGRELDVDHNLWIDDNNG